MPNIAQDMPDDVMRLMAEISFPFDRVAHNCHAVSLALVKSGIYPGSRVARGFAKGVGLGQHSWVVADGGPYDQRAHIIDATLWSYDPTVDRVWQGTYQDGVHKPHGMGHFMSADPPRSHGGKLIWLASDLDGEMSPEARKWLRIVGAPFDYRGWHTVAHLPVGGWPAREIIEAILDTPELAALVPVDIEGMLTDRNPGGVYF